MDARKDRLIELLLLHAFQVRENPPFTLASGKTSPYYVDCKSIMYSPEGLILIGALGYDAVKPLGALAVGGLTLGADPMACAIAMHSQQRSRSIRAFVVRKEVKDHGSQNWIEGDIAPGTKVCILDDVLTSGSSAIQAIERARQAGLDVQDLLVLVDREEGGAEAVEAHGVVVHAVVTVSELLARQHVMLAHKTADV